MAILVRPISLEDIGSFRETLDEVARERRHLALLEAPPLEELRRVVQSNVEQHHGIHFVAVECGEVIGWCDVRPRKEPGFTHIGLLGIGVRPHYRRQGIGHRLLTAAIETALSEGLARIELEFFAPNIPAARLYKSLGFVQEGLSVRARYLDGVWSDVVRMALLSPAVRDNNSARRACHGPVVARVEREAGVSGLTEVLAGLPPTDLQSLMLEVYRSAAKRRTARQLLADYRSNRFVRPGNVPPSKLVSWAAMAISHLPRDFEAIELAPTCPLGTNSVIAAVDQNWAVSTARNTEVVSDPTNVMALECALRRRLHLSTAPKSSQSVNLATRHRILRPQRYTSSNAASHFSLFSLCTAGRDNVGRQFEISALRIHCQFYVELLRDFLGPERTIAVSLTDFGGVDDRARLEREILIPLSVSFVNVTCPIATLMRFPGKPQTSLS
jgi:ribosomal protein S18 acetylase RimI-like enzyme